jgi:hypothetical protein
MPSGVAMWVSMEAVATDTNSDDEEQFLEHGRELADALEVALPGWVERSVRRLIEASGAPVESAALDAARTAGAAAAADVGGRVRELLRLDVDVQVTNPLSLVREAVAYPTEVLRRAGVPAVPRDRFAEERFPHDIYDLAPASFADVDPSLVDVGIQWGAAKAFVHRARHRG